MARAELAGESLEEAFSNRDEQGRGSLSHAQFWEVIPCLEHAVIAV